MQRDLIFQNCRLKALMAFRAAGGMCSVLGS
jgi:hypothetical protein